jgi:hypothetical protein
MFCGLRRRRTDALASDRIDQHLRLHYSTKVLSPIAQQFSLARTAKNLNALWESEPQTAASWFVRYAKAAGLQDARVGQLEKILSSAYQEPTRKDRELRKFLTENSTVAQAVELAQLQSERVHTLGFTATAPRSITFTGKLSVENGAPVITTPDGKFQINSPNWMPSLQYKYFEANALQAFAGRTVTVRAWPTETPDVMAVEEFAPGTSTDFVSGRLSKIGGKVGVRVRPDKWVEIRDPELARRLFTLAQDDTNLTNGTGMILPGKVVQEGSTYFFDGQPADYWMLCKTLPGQPEQLQVGHGLVKPFTGTIDGADTQGRILVFGHLDADLAIVSKGALTTPATRFENGIAFSAPDLATVAKMTPLDSAPVEPDSSGFGL